MQSILVRSVAALAVAGSLAGAAQAASVPVTFERLSGLSGFSGTSVFRADLSGLGLTDIASITLFDSNSKQGGSPGAFSGFDLDAIMLTENDPYWGAHFDADVLLLPGGPGIGITTEEAVRV